MHYRASVSIIIGAIKFVSLIVKSRQIPQ